MVAADQGNFSVVHTLLELGADPDIQSSNGKTALMYAARSGDAKSVDYLLEKRANVDLINKDGHTAYYYADAENPDAAIKKSITAVINKRKSRELIASERSDYGQELLSGEHSISGSSHSPSPSPRGNTKGRYKGRD